MYERAFKVLQQALGEFDTLYKSSHLKFELMYATLVMNLYEVATKMGQPDTARQYLQEGLEKCKERTYVDTFTEHLNKLNVEEDKSQARENKEDVPMEENVTSTAGNDTQMSFSTQADEKDAEIPQKQVEEEKSVPIKTNVSTINIEDFPEWIPRTRLKEA